MLMCSDAVVYLLVQGGRGDAWASESLRMEVRIRSEERELAEENKDLGTVVLHFLVFVTTDGWYEVIKVWLLPTTRLQDSKRCPLSNYHPVPGSM